MACDRARLSWRCRRGMLELDAWLGRFMADHEPLDEADCEGMMRLLDAEDDVIYDWLLGRALPPAGLVDLIARMRET